MRILVYTIGGSLGMGTFNTLQRKGFFIHGYWPSSVDLSFLSCLSYPNKYDPNCYVDYPFNENNISPAD